MKLVERLNAPDAKPKRKTPSEWRILAVLISFISFKVRSSVTFAVSLPDDFQRRLAL
jgi:hypothetical protein